MLTRHQKLWAKFREATTNASVYVLDFVKRKHYNWFNENGQVIQKLLKQARDASQISHKENILSKQRLALERFGALE